MKSSQPLTQYIPLFLLLPLYFLLVMAYSAAIPFSKGPDEYINYEYILFIAQHHRLPATIEERRQAGVKADWQPLYHLAGGLAAASISLDNAPPLKVTWEPPTRQLIDLVLPRATLVRTEDERPPYRGFYAVWQRGREVSMVLGGITLIVTYLIGLTVWPGRPALAAGLTALLVFMPRFLFTHAVLSDDTMLGLCLALFLLCLTRLARQAQIRGARFRLPNLTRPVELVAGLGLMAGLAIVTKYTAVPAVVVAGLTGLYLARRCGWPWSRLLAYGAIFSGALVVAAGWWVGWIWWHFQQINRQGWFMGLIRPLLPGAVVDDNPTTSRLTAFLSGRSLADLGEAPGAGGNFLDWAGHTFATFWGVTVFGAEPAWPYPYPVILLGLGVLFGTAVVGLWRVYRQDEANRSVWIALGLHSLLFFPLPLLRFALSGRLNDAAQGRHLLFPAGPALMALLLAGGLVWLRPAWRGRAALIAGSLMLAWGAGHWLYLASAYPPPLPVRMTTGPQLEIEQPLQLDFAQIVRLAGYEVRRLEAGRVLQLDLLWYSLAQAEEDYQTEISLVDAQTRPRLRWLSQPAQGRFPVRAWQPGDWVRDTLSIPLAGLPAGTYSLQLRLLGDPTLASTEGEVITLATLNLPEETLPPAKAVLWQAGRAITPGEAPVYRYRAAIPLSLPQPGQATLAGPNERHYRPVTDLGLLRLFMVDHTWPSGRYRLHLDGRPTGTVLEIQNFDTRPGGWTFTPPALQYPVQANFGGKIELLGYDLPTRRAEPGGGLPLVLYWRGLTPMRQDYTIAVQLLDAELQRWGGYDRIPRETYNTYLWVPGEVVDDGFAVPVAPGAPPGVYTLRIGWYRQIGDQATPLPLVQAGRPLEETSVVIGPLKIGGPPAGTVVAETSPEQPLTARFADLITLRGYDLAVEAGQLRLKLYWYSEQRTGTDYTTFVHILNPAGDIVAQVDRPPAGGRYPTSLWEPGETILDEIIVPRPEAPPARYTIRVGLYDLVTGARLPLAGAQGDSLSLTGLELD